MTGRALKNAPIHDKTYEFPHKLEVSVCKLESHCVVVYRQCQRILSVLAGQRTDLSLSEWVLMFWSHICSLKTSLLLNFSNSRGSGAALLESGHALLPLPALFECCCWSVLLFVLEGEGLICVGLSLSGSGVPTSFVAPTHCADGSLLTRGWDSNSLNLV